MKKHTVDSVTVRRGDVSNSRPTVPCPLFPALIQRKYPEWRLPLRIHQVSQLSWIAVADVMLSLFRDSVVCLFRATVARIVLTANVDVLDRFAVAVVRVVVEAKAAAFSVRFAVVLVLTETDDVVRLADGTNGV